MVAVSAAVADSEVFVVIFSAAVTVVSAARVVALLVSMTILVVSGIDLVISVVTAWVADRASVVV